jgi:hypothetical protein
VSELRVELRCVLYCAAVGKAAVMISLLHDAVAQLSRYAVQLGATMSMRPFGGSSNPARARSGVSLLLSKPVNFTPRVYMPHVKLHGP